MSPQPSKSFKIALGIFGPLLFHICHEINFLGFIKNLNWDVYWNYLEFVDLYGEIEHLYDLEPPYLQIKYSKTHGNFNKFMLSSCGGHSSIFCISSISGCMPQKQIHHHHFSIMEMYTEGQPYQPAKCAPQTTILTVFMKHKVTTESKGLFRINFWKIISWAYWLPEIDNAIPWHFYKLVYYSLKLFKCQVQEK